MKTKVASGISNLPSGRECQGMQMILKGLIRFLVAAVLICLLQVPTTRTASAQADPRQILAAVIQQLQTGTPNPTWYGPQLWQTIAMQTNNSGVYMQLVQLGPVTNVVVSAQTQLPAGPLYSMVAYHQGGQSTWLLGISLYTNRLEYANFNIGSVPQQLPAQPVPLPQTSAPTPGTTPNPPPNPPPTTSGASDACRRFPNLC